MNDVVLLSADRSAGAGPAGLRQLDGHAAGPVHDAQSALTDRDVGERVRAATTGEVVAAESGYERVVVATAVDGRDVREAAAADDRVVTRLTRYRAAVAGEQRVDATPAADRVAAFGALRLRIDVRGAGRGRAGDRVRPAVASQRVVAATAGQVLDVGCDRIVLARPTVSGARRRARRQGGGDGGGARDAGGGDADIGDVVGAAGSTEGVVFESADEGVVAGTAVDRARRAAGSRVDDARVVAVAEVLDERVDRGYDRDGAEVPLRQTEAGRRRQTSLCGRGRDRHGGVLIADEVDRRHRRGLLLGDHRGVRLAGARLIGECPA